jgi:hypothetical protein
MAVKLGSSAARMLPGPVAPLPPPAAATNEVAMATAAVQPTVAAPWQARLLASQSVTQGKENSTVAIAFLILMLGGRPSDEPA